MSIETAPDLDSLAKETTVVVCCYNGERYVRDLLRSIQAQTKRPAATILVDNGSSDGSVGIVRAEFPDVEVIAVPQNAGPCVARNLGMSHARGRWVFAADVDVVLAPDCLEQCLAVVRDDPGLAVVEPRALDDSRRDLIQYDGAHFHYVGLLSLRNFYRPEQNADGLAVSPIEGFISVAILADRTKLLSAGGYDPAFFYLAEDADLGYRLAMRGERLASASRARVYHRGGTQGLSFRGGEYPSRRVFLMSRNRWLFLAKNYQASTLLIALPGILLYEAAAFFFALAKLAPLQYVKGKIAFLGLLRGALRERNNNQAARRVGDRAILRSGPLTLWPPLTSGRVAGALGAALDGALGLYWRLTGGRR